MVYGRGVGNVEAMEITKAVRIVIMEYEREKAERDRKKAYHNTYLLMKKYNLMKKHVYKVVDDIDTDKLSDGLEFISKQDVWVISICKSKTKSLKMLSYIDSALETIYKEYERKGKTHEYRAFELYFIEEKTYEEIAKYLNCGKNTPKKWTDNILEDLSVLLWGYEAFKE